jgi:predicted acyltransferase
MLKFVPVPGVGAGVWTMDGNLAHYLDRLLLPGRLYYGTWDVEGLLTTIPAVTTCLLGVLTGHCLRPSGSGKGQNLTAEQRAKYLFLGGLALSALGLLLSRLTIGAVLITAGIVLVSMS